MKIDVTKIRHGLITHKQDLIKRDLFADLYQQIYARPYRMAWQTSKQDRTLAVLKFPAISLAHMAASLRQQGWGVYYWRDPHGVDAGDDTNTHINYGRREGLVFGIYCANLSAWLLANT